MSEEINAFKDCPAPAICLYYTVDFGQVLSCICRFSWGLKHAVVVIFPISLNFLIKLVDACLIFVYFFVSSRFERFHLSYPFHVSFLLKLKNFFFWRDMLSPHKKSKYIDTSIRIIYQRTTDKTTQAFPE